MKFSNNIRQFSTVLYVCFLMCALLPKNMKAQVPQAFNYQGIARDEKGNPFAKQTLSIQLSILSTADATFSEYQEVQNVNTDEFGLYTLQIGHGKSKDGDLKSVKWETGNKYIRVAIDPHGGSNYIVIGTTQLLSVPFAIYADKAGISKEILGGTTSSSHTRAGTMNYVEKSTIAGTFGIINDQPSQIFDNGTGVGIGWVSPSTTSPLAKLEVRNGDALINGVKVGRGNSFLPSNTALGQNALNGNTTGSNNTGTGARALNLNTTGKDNTANGEGSLFSNKHGIQNTALGSSSLTQNVTGSDNVGLGYRALNNNKSNSNTAVGSNSLISNTTGRNNTAIGFRSDILGGNLQNATAIGANALVSQDNSLVLGGIASVNGATSDTKVGIGITNPQYKLDLAGQLRINDGNPGIGKVLTCISSTGLASWESIATSTCCVPNGTANGEMLYWNGSAWVTVTPGATGQTLSYCNGVPTWGPCPPGINIGDPYQGGIVAYVLQNGDPGFDPLVPHGIIVAPSDFGPISANCLPGGYFWGCPTISVSTSELYGTGATNTSNIITSCSTTNIAAELCANFTITDPYTSVVYSDWFLPSKDELIYIYGANVIIGTFKDCNYWSSSQDPTDPTKAFKKYFGSGSEGSAFKNDDYRVRAVRYF